MDIIKELWFKFNLRARIYPVDGWIFKALLDLQPI
jgi:hypothetical protein